MHTAKSGHGRICSHGSVGLIIDTLEVSVTNVGNVTNFGIGINSIATCGVLQLQKTTVNTDRQRQHPSEAYLDCANYAMCMHVHAAKYTVLRCNNPQVASKVGQY